MFWADSREASGLVVFMTQLVDRTQLSCHLHFLPNILLGVCRAGNRLQTGSFLPPGLKRPKWELHPVTSGWIQDIM